MADHHCPYEIFLAGYVFFDIVRISGLPFSVEVVTGVVFLGGAVFVFVIINLAQHTIRRVGLERRLYAVPGLAGDRASIRMHIGNLSNRQLGHKDLVQTVTRILKDVERDPSHLELEITESTIMQIPENQLPPCGSSRK